MVGVQGHSCPETFRIRSAPRNGKPELVSADVRETDDAVIVTLVLPKVDLGDIAIECRLGHSITVSWNGTPETQRVEHSELYDDVRLSPQVEVSFKNDDDMSRAWNLVPRFQPRVGLPNRGMIVDIPLLRRFQAAGIPIYPSAVPVEERYHTPVDIDDLIQELRELQLSWTTGE